MNCGSREKLQLQSEMNHGNRDNVCIRHLDDCPVIRTQYSLVSEIAYGLIVDCGGLTSLILLDQSHRRWVTGSGFPTDGLSL
jgi:hypothetical protein